MSDESNPSQPKTAQPAKEWKVYTKFGDAGYTMLYGKVKVPKDSPRVWVYGTLDEATSAMGVARATTQYDDIVGDIVDVQGELIGVMGELATAPGVQPPGPPLEESQVSRLEKLIDHYEEERIPTRHFIRPGNSLAGAQLDLARTIVRRAERLLIALSKEEEVNPVMLRYLNRLSDFLYVLARIDEQREIRKRVMSAFESAEKPVLPPGGKSVLDLATCNRLVDAGISRAREIGVPMVLAIVDASGNLVELRRMDDALVVSISLAPNKAWTAAAVRLPTHEIAKASQPGESLYGIDTNLPNFTLVGGGFPLRVGGVVVGAVGVSGGSVEQDIDVAQAMVAALS